jgi:hypothetical protein
LREKRENENEKQTSKIENKLKSIYEEGWMIM